MDKFTLPASDFALTTDALATMQSAYEYLQNIAYIAGSSVMIYGGTVSNGVAASGIIYLGGKLMPFTGGTVTTNVRVIETTTTTSVGTGSRTKTTYYAEFGTSTDDAKNYAWEDITTIDNIVTLMNRLSEAEGLAEENETDIQALYEEKADITNVLELDNEDEFTPSSDYHPATKKYVDNVAGASGLTLKLIASVSSSGSATKVSGSLSVSATRNSEGYYTVTHSLNSTSYRVIANVVGSSITTGSENSTHKVAAIERSANSFDIVIADDNERDDADFEFMMFSI